MKLAQQKARFDLVLCADYQMCKLVPYWGCSAEPGSTFYLQKLNHDIFGIVNHGSGCSTVYLFDERVGPKNTDITQYYLTLLTISVRCLAQYGVCMFFLIILLAQTKKFPNGLGSRNGAAKKKRYPSLVFFNSWTHLIFTRSSLQQYCSVL